MRALKSADLNGLGAAWKESVSAREGGAGVAEVEAEAEAAMPDGRGLGAVLREREEKNVSRVKRNIEAEQLCVHLHDVVRYSMLPVEQSLVGTGQDDGQAMCQARKRRQEAVHASNPTLQLDPRDPTLLAFSQCARN